MLTILAMVAYLVFAVLTARSEARRVMLRNEGRDYNGIEMEARVYTNREYLDMAATRYEGDTPTHFEWRISVAWNESDIPGITLAGAFFPFYWIKRLLCHSVLDGHRRTTEQMRRDNEAQARRISELEKELDREL